jgi:hypothetical protein
MTMNPATRVFIGLIVGLGMIAPVMAGDREIFVSPTGSDLNPGTEAKPLATLEAARDAVRRVKSGDPLPREGVTVWLEDGDYLRSQALELTAADSGTATAPIVWRARPHAAPRLLGGRALTGFTPITDPELRARLAEPARDQVLRLDLRTLGLAEFGAMRSRGFGRPLTPSHCELFYQGKPMTLARWPNAGEFSTIAGFPEAGAQGDDHGGKLGRLTDGFFYSGDRPRGWRQPDDLWVHGYWAWDWANSYERVTALDLQRRLVQTAPPHGLYGFRQGQRIFFLNVLEELDEPGEYYVDRREGVLYFWPPTGAADLVKAGSASPSATAARADRRGDSTKPAGGALLSLLEQPLLKLTGVSHVTFRGLILEATRASAVEISGGTSNLVAGCLIRNIGNYGVRLQGGTGHGVISCDVLDTGDGGVDVSGGDRQTLTPGGHFVENCHFQRQGRWSKCYVPAVHLVGVGLRATHNLIHDHPHCAILFGGNDHLVAFNEIHHIALETGDVGAIYTGRDYTYRGNRIRHNFIHHTGGVGMGSMGAYMDDCVSGTEIYGNIFYRVQRAAFLGGGRDHPVINNIFVDCHHAVELDGRGLDRSPVWRGMVDQTMRQRLADVPLALYRERYPEMKSLDAHYGPPGGPAVTGDAFQGVPPEGNVVARNICVGKWLNVYWQAKPEMLRLEGNLTNAITSFVNLPPDASKATDFTLRTDAPAWKLGFEAIPMARIGLQPDALRRELEEQLRGGD